MGLDYHFHLQHFNGDIWTTPTELDDPTDRVMHGELTWFDDKDVTVHRLFVRDDSLFPLHRTLPPDFVITELYRTTNRSPDMSDADVLEHIQNCFDDHYFGWIGFEDLATNLWSETHLLVQKKVPARLAWAFGDGSHKFPRDSLLTLGLPERDVDELANTSNYAYDKQFSPTGYSIVDRPINRVFGDGPNDEALVTWKLTIAEFIGDWRMNALQNARKVATDDRLRIICTFS
ncbi:hypothetical protein [Lignipirellula cremea]|uniref:Uncharacterized protein n=1 Tax=Lignipirellula cremea TaxID=2528010 RepID=A0A518DZZ4_9BACT|nr:hypothetical protein [Lignipirellula cremea]QDU97420.1 hypothetical protein Pla8534_52680 [Lignipirellula cremea]